MQEALHSDEELASEQGQQIVERQSGSTSIEYALLALLMSAGLIAALYAIRAILSGFIVSVASSLQQAIQ